VHTDSCPFVASPGARPPRLAGRAPLLDALGDRIAALQRGEPARPLAWLGRVGEGRTAVLHEAAKRAAAQGWAPAIATVTREVPLEHELARGIAAAVLHHGRKHPDEPKLVELLGVARAYAAAHDLDLPLEAPMAEISWPGTRLGDAGALFERVADGLRSIGSGCFLALDDADHADREVCRDVIAAAGQLAGAGRAFLLVVTGLPGTMPAELTEQTVLGPLTPPDVLDALSWPAAERGIEIRHDTVAAIGRRTQGHPYFVQAFAKAAWAHSDQHRVTPDDITAVALDVERDLRASFFAPVLDGLSSSELRFVRAVADAGRRATFAEVANRLGDPVRFDPATSRLAPIRDDLLARGVLYVGEGEVLEFALPYLERYVRTTD